MRIVFFTLMVYINLFAYQKGDVIPESMTQHLGMIEDKIYILDFFASWCGSCKKEIPLISIANSKIDSTKVEIIGIDVDKDVNKGIRFQESLKTKKELNFRVINDSQNLIVSKFNPVGMPTLYYVKNKKIVKIITGAIDSIDEQILKDLKEIE